MIQVSIGMCEEHIISLQCKGHAGYAEAGKDLVCAGVSSILFGALNALDEMEKGNVGLLANCFKNESTAYDSHKPAHFTESYAWMGA